MELDKDKIMQEELARVRVKGSALLDFNPGPSRYFLEGMVVDGASIFSDTKSWYLHNDKVMEKKKMTKAEALEWLKCKKVSVANREINNKVQSKLFACGVEWKYRGTDVCYYGDYLVINPEGFLCHCDGMGSDYWSRLFHEEISAEEILSIEIVEDTKPDCERNEHVKALQELIAKSGCIDCIIISKNDIGILKK